MGGDGTQTPRAVLLGIYSTFVMATILYDDGEQTPRFFSGFS